MGNVRKLMARLNPASVKFNVGRGGIPDLTPQDIAAAIGMANHALGEQGELAMAVFCAAWWPDDAQTSRKAAQRQLLYLVVEEGNRREQAALAANLRAALMFADLTPGRRAVKPPNVMQAEAAAARAEAGRWPRITGGLQNYLNLCAAVVDEVTMPPHCRTCEGRGAVPTEGGPRRCTNCNGTGVVAKSGRARAEAIGIGEKAMRTGWGDVYDWAYRRASDAESTAAVAISRAVFGREASAA